jgi:pseudouridine-5'-phosphate glycosidase
MPRISCADLITSLRISLGVFSPGHQVIVIVHVIRWLFLTAGLEENELRKLAQLGNRAVKTSRRDIAHVVSS